MWFYIYLSAGYGLGAGKLEGLACGQGVALSAGVGAGRVEEEGAREGFMNGRVIGANVL